MKDSLSQDAVYKLGKVTNKYLILEILSYIYEDLREICDHLHKTSTNMRQLLIFNYVPLKNLVFNTHVSFEETLPLTLNPKTSRSAH